MRHIVIFFIGFVFCIGVITQANAADIKVVATSIEGSYSSATSYNDNYKSRDSIDHAENYGFGVEMKMRITPMVRLTFGFNYTAMKCSEYDPKLAFMRNNPNLFKAWRDRDNFFLGLFTEYERWEGPDQNLILLGYTKVYHTTYDYQYHMHYLNAPIGIEISPVQKGFFQPFIGASLSLCKFYQMGYWIMDWTASNYKDKFGHVKTKHWKWKQYCGGIGGAQRGYFLNGVISGGFDLMFNQTFGFQVKARYFQTLKDNKRNRITGFYNINAGLVIHQ